jgi:hypothetical protein
MSTCGVHPERVNLLKGVKMPIILGNIIILYLFNLSLLKLFNQYSTINAHNESVCLFNSWLSSDSPPMYAQFLCWGCTNCTMQIAHYSDIREGYDITSISTLQMQQFNNPPLSHMWTHKAWSICSLVHDATRYDQHLHSSTYTRMYRESISKVAVTICQ